jgi:hypothetical protein
MLERDYQLAILNLFTAEDRLRFEMLKYDELLELDWSPGERGLIEELRDFLLAHPELFERGWYKDEELRDLSDRFQYRLAARAMEEFGWDQVVLRIFSPYVRVIDTKGAVEVIAGKSTDGGFYEIARTIKTRSENGGGNTLRTCNCEAAVLDCPSVEHGVSFRWTCNYGTCNRKLTGCRHGLSYLGPCSGLCSWYGIVP